MDATKGPAGKLLVVDDEPANVELLARLMRRRGYEVTTAANGQLALDAVSHEQPDLVLLDVNMPVLDGFDTCRRLKADAATRLIPVVIVTGLSDLDDRLRGIDAGADDFLTKPFTPVEIVARVRSLIRLKRYTDELESAATVIRSLALTVESRDPYTGGHCERLSRYASILGTKLGLDRAAIEALRIGGVLHDVGKIGIPDAILLKPAELSPEERAIMQRHTTIGETLLGDLRSLSSVRTIVRHHHERVDGTGYPDGLSGDSIPIGAQVIAIVDAFDAITTDRPYRARRTVREACVELRDEARQGWKDPLLVEQFVALVDAGWLDQALLLPYEDRLRGSQLD